MKRTLPIVLVFLGLAFAMIANGSLYLWPTVTVTAPEFSSVVVSPVISFGLLALAHAATPRVLNQSVISGATAFLIAICIIVLSPSLIVSDSTDAQAGMFQALFAMATLPFSILALLVAVVVQFAYRAKTGG